MKVVIVNCFDTYEDRVDLYMIFLSKMAIMLRYIQSDFRAF